MYVEDTATVQDAYQVHVIVKLAHVIVEREAHPGDAFREALSMARLLLEPMHGVQLHALSSWVVDTAEKLFRSQQQASPSPLESVPVG